MNKDLEIVKNLVIIYDQNDVIENDNSIESFTRKYVNQYSGEVENFRTIIDENTQSEVVQIKHYLGVVTFVHESLWVFNEVEAESQYGNTKYRKAIIFNDDGDVDKLSMRVNEAFTNLF